MPHLRIYGVPTLVDGAGLPVRLQSRKQLALLVYLALEARTQPVPRDRLIGLFWGDVPEARARRSLYQALSVLRGRLGPDAVPLREPGVWLIRDLATDIDLLRSGPVLPEGDLATPLQGFEHVGGSAFGQWLDVARERLRRAACDGLSWRLNAARRAGDAMLVHEHAAQLYRVDHLSEPAVQALCEQLLLEGDNVGAARLLRDHLSRLESDTGVAAGPLLRRLLQLVEKGHLATRRVDRTAPLASRHRRPEAFVGRQFELGALERKWGEVLAGRRRTCLVAGPAGIGKSSVLMRFSTSVSARAAAVWEVSCQEIGSNIPYAAVSDLITALTRYPAAGGADARWLSEAARVAPALRTRLTGIPEPPPVPADAVRLRLAEALVRIIEVVAEDGPMLLVLDDLAYLDPASRDILLVLLHRLEHAPLMVAASAGTTDAQGLLGTQHGSGAGVAWDAVLALQPLERVEVEEMIAALCGVHRPDGLALNTLVDLAQGNPYMVEMLLADWQRQPEDSLVAAWGTGDERAARWCPPPSLHRVFARQHRGLPNAADRMLCLLAVAGRKLSAGDLGRLLGLASAESDVAALELLDRGVVRIEEGGLCFKNQLHRSFAYNTMGDERRKFLHGQVGADLERSGLAEFQDMLEAAHHHMYAGHPTRAVDTLIVGAELALSRGAPQEAARAIERTLTRSPGYRRDELGVLLAETQLAQGRHGTATETVNELDTVKLQPALRARAVLVAAEAHQRGQLAPQVELVHLAQSALAVAQVSGDEGLVFRALQLSAEVAHDAADESTVEMVYRQASEMAAASTRTAITPTAAMTLGYCLMVSGRHMEAAHHFATSAEGFRIQKRETELRRALNGLGICLTNTGEVDKAVDSFQQALALAKHAGDPFAQSIIWDNLAVISEDTGRYHEAVTARKLAFELEERAATAKRRAEVLTNAASLATTLGCNEEADTYLDIALRLARDSGIPGLVITALVARADLCIVNGDLGSAWSWTEEALGIASRDAATWRPIGDFERVRLHFIWATQGQDAYEATRSQRPLPGLSFRLSQRLELQAFQEWVAEQDGTASQPGRAVDELARNGFFGAILRLVRLGICPSGLIPNAPSLTSVERLTSAFPGCLQVPLPEQVDVPLAGVEWPYSS